MKKTIILSYHWEREDGKPITGETVKILKDIAVETILKEVEEGRTKGKLYDYDQPKGEKKWIHYRGGWTYKESGDQWHSCVVCHQDIPSGHIHVK